MPAACPMDPGQMATTLQGLAAELVTLVRPEEEVVLLGRQGKASVTAGDMAAWAETIPYEILCGLTARVPRVYS